MADPHFGDAGGQRMDAPHFGGQGVNPRDCLALALDLPDLTAAVRLAESLIGHFRVAKVGLELYSACGPDAIRAMLDLGYNVFCDLKLHDIPTTVHKASRVVAGLGASYLTVHAAGGLDMLRAAVAGLTEGADTAEGFLEGAGTAEGAAVTASTDSAASDGAALILAVTVLTSERDAPEGLLERRMAMAAAADCGGIVCAASDLPVAARVDGKLIRAVPGIRLPGDPRHDQSRVATPAEARAAGADLLVVGRSITQAPDPVAAADRLHAHLCRREVCIQRHE